jgi:hypothetical protein
MIDLENDRLAYAVLSFDGFLDMGKKLPQTHEELYNVYNYYGFKPYWQTVR